MPTNAPTARVLVPLDGSDLGEAILPLLEARGHPWGTEVLLLRSVTMESPPGPSAQEAAGDYLAAQARRLERAGLRVEREVWHGDPKQTIVNAAAGRGVGLVAMTTHGLRGLDRLRFGSVAESVIRKAPVPVLLVRGRLRWPTERPPRILVPLDGSAQSAAILTIVTRLLQPLRGAVELLHVFQEPHPGAHPDLPSSLTEAQRDRAAARKYLERVAIRLASKGVEVQWSVLDGPVVPMIVERIAEGNVDLVAMTTHGRSGVARLLLGSVAEQVLRTVDVPVLLWKAPVPPVAARRGGTTEGALHGH